ncbi:MAG TPA: helix-turn-helix domain-containing protein [Candidatus Dormibacteraeota bacterium]|nr:helix-turn-helix domain-containing protein [Candidatus Dormibacteraeota bacterium]
MSLAEAPRLPAEVSATLLAGSDKIARRLARRLSEELELPPEFSRIRYLRAIVAACRGGLQALLRQLHDGRKAHPAELATLGLAGAQQAELGVPLEVLLRGYRLAAKVVWREVVDAGTRMGGLSPETVVALSEQVLEYLDEISGAVGGAYLETRERLVRQRDRERDRVLGRLLAGDASSELRRLAAACDLELRPPYRILACAVAPGADADRLLGAAWRSARALLVVADRGVWTALVDGDAEVDALCRSGYRAMAAAGDGALVIGVGPVAATLDEVAAAARRAHRALDVGRRLRPGELVHEDVELGVFAALDADPDALRAHVGRLLGGMVDGSARSAEQLRTLEAVLGSRSLGDAAARLGVHRHTVVYRLERIGALLATDLEDPLVRHRLWLALQAHRLLSEQGGGRTLPG